MRLPPFAYHAPTSLAEVLRIKADLGAAAHFLAGGTDLVVNLKHRLTSPAAVISLRNVKDLKGIEAKPDSVVIRAGTTLAEIARHEGVREHFPVLVKAVNSIGAVGIQHFRGTIGGNLCLWPRCILYNQSQFWRQGKGQCHRTGGKDCLALKGSESCLSVCSGDTVPVLAALSAQLGIAGSGGNRTVSINDFFTGKGETPFNLAPDEIVTDIRLHIPWAPYSWSYQRLSFRSAVDFPLVNAAALAIQDKGVVETFRVVLSAAGPAPVVLREAESVVKGNAAGPEMASKVAEIAVKAAEGIMAENTISPKEYRIRAAGIITRRAVKEALGI